MSLSPAEMEEESSRYPRLFEGFRAMHRLLNFRLVLCVHIWNCVGEHSTQLLKQFVAAEKARGGFDDIFPEPPVFRYLEKCY